MSWINFRLLVFVFGLLLPQFAFATLNHNHNSIKALSKAYGFLLGQEYSLKRIAMTYPALRPHVDIARFTFASSFGGVEQKLEKELSEAIGEANFRKLRQQLDKQLADVLSRQALSSQLASEFLEKVKTRAKGADIEADVLRYLLAIKYSSAPVAEFADGFRQRFNTDGTGKAQGIKLRLQLPRSWLAQEGERPHIVKKWTNEGGTGTSVILLDIRHAEGYNPTAREIQEFVKSGEARQTFADLGKVHDVGTFSVERRAGYWAELSMVQERAGLRMYQRGMMYQLFFKGKAIGVMCMAGAAEGESQKADLTSASLKPLCQQVVNSLVLEQAY